MCWQLYRVLQTKGAPRIFITSICQIPDNGAKDSDLREIFCYELSSRINRMFLADLYPGLFFRIEKIFHKEASKAFQLDQRPVATAV